MNRLAHILQVMNLVILMAGLFALSHLASLTPPLTAILTGGSLG